jgi:glycosyltransferase involved in cell wall biosynthesis
MREVEKNIFVMNPLAIPAYGSRAMVAFNQKFLIRQVKSAMRKLGMKNVINMVFNPAAGMIAGRLGESELLYYCVDEYTAFTGVSAGLKEIEDDLFRKSDLVVVSAETLLEAKKKFNEKTYLIRHGVDFNHFRKALDDGTEIPPEIANLPRPIIGFHGLLADWVDFGLLKKIAEYFKDGSLVLIGKTTFDAEKKIKILDGVPNIHLLGRKPYEQLPAYCKGFDVALNPFVMNELTRHVNPLKVREYLAAGVEVVSTDIQEVRVLPHCEIGSTDADFIAKIERILANPKPREEVSDSIRHESWDAKVDELRAIIEKGRRGATENER